MGNSESHFNASLIVKDKVTRQCPQSPTFEAKGETKQNRTEVFLLTNLNNALPLGQTGSEERPFEVCASVAVCLLGPLAAKRPTLTRRQSPFDEPGVLWFAQ